MQNRRNEQRKRERVRGKAASMHLAVGKEMRPDKKKKKKEMRPDKTGFHRQQQAPPSCSEAAWFSAPYIMLLLLLFTSILEEIIA